MLIIVLVGAIAISILESVFSLRLEQHEVQIYASTTNQEYSSFFGRFVIPGFLDLAARIWRFLGANHEALLAAFGELVLGDLHCIEDFFRRHPLGKPIDGRLVVIFRQVQPFLHDLQGAFDGMGCSHILSRERDS